MKRGSRCRMNTTLENDCYISAFFFQISFLHRFCSTRAFLKKRKKGIGGPTPLIPVQLRPSTSFVNNAQHTHTCMTNRFFVNTSGSHQHHYSIKPLSFPTFLSIQHIHLSINISLFCVCVCVCCAYSLSCVIDSGRILLI